MDIDALKRSAIFDLPSLEEFFPSLGWLHWGFLGSAKEVLDRGSIVAKTSGAMIFLAAVLKFLNLPPIVTILYQTI
jgi:hypothetical protein